MAKPHPKHSVTIANFDAARRVAVMCARVSGRNAPPSYINRIAKHIVTKLSPTIMRELVKGDWSRSQWAAMKLTLPFFVPP